MLQDHANIVRFIAAAEGITGRKKLQKMMYIAKKLDYPVKEKYEFHMYGPYSEELTVRVEELCNIYNHVSLFLSKYYKQCWINH